jgi:hypothetical protein
LRSDRDGKVLFGFFPQQRVGSAATRPPVDHECPACRSLALLMWMVAALRSIGPTFDIHKLAQPQRMPEGQQDEQAVAVDRVDVGE